MRFRYDVTLPRKFGLNIYRARGENYKPRRPLPNGIYTLLYNYKLPKRRPIHLADLHS